VIAAIRTLSGRIFPVPAAAPNNVTASRVAPN
jgi:hypothetical protein